MEVTKLREDLTQCWLAEALANVLERATTQCQVDSYELVSIGNDDVATQGAVLSTLMNAFLRQSDVVNGEVASKIAGDNCNVHVKNVDDLQRWVAVRLADAPDDGVLSAKGMLCMVYAPFNKGIATQALQSIVEAATKLRLGRQKLVLLVLQDPSGLLGLEANSARGVDDSPKYYLKQFDDGTEINDKWRRNFKLIAHPLERLQEQCGWRFVMEIVQWVTGAMSEMRSGNEKNGERSPGEASVAMYSSINQLPFQLLLLVLRWSHFHPQLVQACLKKLQRQMRLIPQARVRNELEILQKCETQLWSGLYPPPEMPVTKLSAHSTQEKATSLLFLDTSSRSRPVSPELSRLSDCRLWDTQKQFYKDQGIRAWSSGTIPFGVSSSSFLAESYARIAVDFLLTNSTSIEHSHENGLPNCFVWEAASGSCKFLHSFMLHFLELVAAENEFQKRGLVPLVVATDLSEQVLDSRRQMECFRPFIERGQLDFALFDTHDFVHGAKKRKTLELLYCQRQWSVGSDGPVILIGNYFLDSLRADVFTVAKTKRKPAVNGSNDDDCINENIVIQEAFLARDTSSIADMDISLRAIADPSLQAVYRDSRLNGTLVQVLEQFRSRSSCTSRQEVDKGTESTGIILFPVEALQFLLVLLEIAEDNQQKAFPVAILAGDAGFSFRDAISNAFISTTTDETSLDGKDKCEAMSLELPQLSPHPDCFCLPVDFEIFMMFFQHLNHSNNGVLAHSQVVSAPASDTFDIFFATFEPQSNASTPRINADITSNPVTRGLHTSFDHEFAHFTPGDCDLLWGMMSFDDGARCFSSDTLLSLLEQTGWDFDLFAVLHWELLRRWRRHKFMPESEIHRGRLIKAGVKCWRTFYVMEQHVETDITARETRLQLARWFYELDAYQNVLEVLSPWREEPHRYNSKGSVGMFYLLGLTSMTMHKYWAALAFFRVCARLAPTKLKFQRHIAHTLLTLQTIRSASNSSNESDAGDQQVIK